MDVVLTYVSHDRPNRTIQMPGVTVDGIHVDTVIVIRDDCQLTTMLLLLLVVVRCVLIAVDVDGWTFHLLDDDDDDYDERMGCQMIHQRRLMYFVLQMSMHDAFYYYYYSTHYFG